MGAIDTSQVTKPKFVLVVDDDDVILQCTKDMLSDRFTAINIVCFQTVKEAVEFFQKNKNLITHAIVDFEMPKHKGTSLATYFKQESPDIRIALFTGHDDVLQSEESVASLNRIIIKPTMGELIEFVSGEKF